LHNFKNTTVIKTAAGMTATPRSSADEDLANEVPNTEDDEDSTIKEEAEEKNEPESNTENEGDSDEEAIAAAEIVLRWLGNLIK
jgi:hypothetical protein